ncbi:MAG TPA: hypothetical protein VJI13_02230 [Candidatus Norongarragalinales archaeon]|nr:hypothetical protein [Candidatus Norongarragalinales archaeon]
MAQELTPHEEAQKIVEKINRMWPDASISHVRYGKPLAGFQVETPRLEDQHAVRLIQKAMRLHSVSVQFGSFGGRRIAYLSRDTLGDTDRSDAVLHAISSLIDAIISQKAGRTELPRPPSGWRRLTNPKTWFPGKKHQ